MVQRHISFVDCPGHDMLMATMLNVAAVMDAAMLLIAANEVCPQTSEHLAAVDYEFKPYQGSKAQNSPIIPISAQFKHNIDVVIEYMQIKTTKNIHKY